MDIATHPPERLPLIEDALRAGKHVLSQKPFVLDLDAGERLAGLADAQGVKLAVNQNGRWSPHFSYIRQAVRAGLLGDLLSIHQGVHWDHTWTAGTPFDDIPDLVLYDFAIHWFDFVSHLLGERNVIRVHASKSRAMGQTAKPPMLAQSLIEFDGGQASLVFDAQMKYGSYDHTYIGGSAGSILSVGPHIAEQTLTLTTAAGAAVPKLEGSWFPDGFLGSMGELLCAIEDNRAAYQQCPRKSARAGPVLRRHRFRQRRRTENTRRSSAPACFYSTRFFPARSDGMIYAIGFDLGGTNLKVVAVSAEGHCS